MRANGQFDPIEPSAIVQVRTVRAELNGLRDQISRLQSQVAELNARNARQSAALASLHGLLGNVSRETVNGRDTLRFSGMNVQVLDGSGDTGCQDAFAAGNEPCNGTGTT